MFRANRVIVIVFVLAAAVLWTTGCSEDDEEVCDKASSACGSFTTCCTSDNCYYLADDGKRFNCDGTDCEDAAQRMAEYMCAANALTPEEFDELVEAILRSADEQFAHVHEGIN